MFENPLYKESSPGPSLCMLNLFKRIAKAKLDGSIFGTVNLSY